MQKLKILLYMLILVFGFMGYQIIKQSLRSDDNGKAMRVGIKNEILNHDNALTISLKTSDGLCLEGLYIKRNSARRKFLVAHGFKQSKESYAHLIELYPHDTFLLVDLRAHGESDGYLITYGCNESLDIFAAYCFLKNEHPDLPIIGIGFSMGAAALAKALYEGVHFNGLILDSSYANLQQQIDRSFQRMTGLPKKCNFLAHWFYTIVVGKSPKLMDVGMFLEKTKIPILLVHSKEDTFTPVEDVNTIGSHVMTNKVIKIVNKGKHANIVQNTPMLYKKIVDDFLECAKL